MSVMAVEVAEIKTCCAALYESDWARLLLGDSFHPGGMALTRHLGDLMGLGPQDCVLDVAAGPGTSARFLAEQFGCEVVGIDYSSEMVTQANTLTLEAGLAERVRFEQADAEYLPFEAATFDAIICECAFCVFPNKTTSAREFVRVLRPGGRLGLSDLTRAGPIPKELEGLLGWIACMADAQPIERYVAYLTQAGFQVDLTEDHDHVLEQMVDEIRSKLVGAELLMKLKQVDIAGLDFDSAKALARKAMESVKAGKLGYAAIVGSRPA